MKLIKKIIPAALAVAVVVGGCIIVGNNISKKKELETLRAEYSGKPVGMTVTAHTGCMDTSDNSEESIRTGMKNGDIVEFDVRFNSEGVPVLTHDGVTGGEMTMEEALAIVAENDRTMVNADLKECTKDLAKVAKVIKKSKLGNRVFFTGVNEEDVEAVKLYCPKTKYYLNYDVDAKRAQNKIYQGEIIAKLKETGAVGLNFNYVSAHKDLVKAVQDAGFEVSIFTVDEEVDMYKIIAMKPDNITTRNPDLMNSLWKLSHEDK